MKKLIIFPMIVFVVLILASCSSTPPDLSELSTDRLLGIYEGTISFAGETAQVRLTVTPSESTGSRGQALFSAELYSYKTDSSLKITCSDEHDRKLGQFECFRYTTIEALEFKGIHNGALWSGTWQESYRGEHSQGSFSFWKK